MQGTIICNRCLGTFGYERLEFEKYHIRPRCPYCGNYIGKDDVEDVRDNDIYQNEEWESYFKRNDEWRR